MKSEYHKHDKTNAIQLRAIYDIGVGIAKSFIDKAKKCFYGMKTYMVVATGY